MHFHHDLKFPPPPEDSNQASKHEQKRCPRCGRLFVCKVSNIAQCDCSRVTLSKEVSEFIAGRYGECLCLTCLRILSEEPHPNRPEENDGPA